MKTKKKLKAKEPVKLRYKELKHGNKSLYLDYYCSGQRRYEFLKLYLIPETDDNSRIQNIQTLRAATSIKSSRILEINNGKAGIKTDMKPVSISLDELIVNYICYKEGKCSKKTMAKIFNFRNAISGLDTKTNLDSIDANYCKRLISYLRNKPNAKYSKDSGKHISECTVRNYFSVFCAMMNYAVRKGFIKNNPAGNLENDEKPNKVEGRRCFLTIEELQSMINTSTRHVHTRTIFLFSCFCGLRYSDIRRLQWKDIELNNGRYYANIVMQKTRTNLYLPLNRQAVSFLPERPADAKVSDRIFAEVSPNSLSRHLAEWSRDAGISKHITFHCARHSFATISLTLGADLYTTSKLLGHSNITTTQIYAKIINEKKDDAVALFDKVF